MITEPINLTNQGWYWPMRDGSIIGPYRDKEECFADYERYKQTGRISNDPTGKVGACCADCEPT